MVIGLDSGTDSTAKARVCPACGTSYPPTTRFCASDGQVLRDEGSETDWLVGKLIAERYYVDRQLGVGGMGVVYLAQQVYMSRKCALKVLRPEFLKNADAVGRFARGAQNASRISHPNVAAVYDFGEVAGESMYLAMEYVEGQALGGILTSAGKLSISRTATIVSQIASALKAAHELGIVHRDLKPDNIMLARSGDSDDLVKVVDFGIARAVMDEAQQMTGSSVIIGTPAYMSPEQIAGDNIDARSDIYSLALVTYAMLTGRLPLSNERVDLAIRFLQSPKTLRELDATRNWPDDLQQVLNKALASDPSERHENVQQFARDLIDALRRWQPSDIASSLSALTMLGVDVTSALPPDMIVRWATPELEQPALTATGTRRGKRRRVAVFGGGAVLLGTLGTFGFVALTKTAADRAKQVTIGNAPSTHRTESTSALLAVVPSNVSSAVAESSVRASLGTTLRRTQEAVRSVRPTAARSTTVRPNYSTNAEPTTSDSAPVAAKPMDSVVTAVLPTTGVIRIGTPAMLGAALYMNSELVGIVAGLRSFTVPAGSVRLRLHLEQCRDWDSTVMVGRGDTVVVGTRRPTCAP